MPLLQERGLAGDYHTLQHLFADMEGKGCGDEAGDQSRSSHLNGHFLSRGQR